MKQCPGRPHILKRVVGLERYIEQPAQRFELEIVRAFREPPPVRQKLRYGASVKKPLNVQIHENVFMALVGPNPQEVNIELHVMAHGENTGERQTFDLQAAKDIRQVLARFHSLKRKVVDFERGNAQIVVPVRLNINHLLHDDLPVMLNDIGHLQRRMAFRIDTARFKIKKKNIAHFMFSEKQ
jgi:hypothetical protein